MDHFEGMIYALDAPARGGQAVFPDDNADLSTVTRALYVGTGGDIAVEMLSGDLATFRQVPAGSLVPLRVRKVLSSGTTAADIVGLW